MNKLQGVYSHQAKAERESDKDQRISKEDFQGLLHSVLDQIHCVFHVILPVSLFLFIDKK